MRRWSRRTLVGVATAALLGAGGFARSAVADSAANHVFVGASAGFIGCFEFVGSYPGVCLEAVQQSDGLHLSYFDGFIPEEAVDPAGSITATTVGTSPAVAVDATLPNAGRVHIVSAGGSLEVGVGCEACWRPNYDIHTDAVSPAVSPPQIWSYGVHFGTSDDGTIGGRAVTSHGRQYFEFNSHWLGTPVHGFYAGPAVGLYAS